MLSGAFAGLAGAFLADRGHRQLARGPDAGPRVHRARRAHPVELEPEAPDVGSDGLRLRAGDPATGSHDAPVISLIPPEFVRMIPYIVTIVVIAGFVGKVQTPGGRGQGVRGRRRALADQKVPCSRSPKSPRPGRMNPTSFSWRSSAPGDDRHVGMLALQQGDPLGRRHHADEA